MPPEQYCRVRKAEAKLAAAEAREAAAARKAARAAARDAVIVRNITDPDSRLMATRNGKQQCYNPQQVVSEDNLVIATELTDDPTDMAWFEPMMAQAEQAAALILAHKPPAPAAPAADSGDAPQEPASGSHGDLGGRDNRRGCRDTRGMCWPWLKVLPDCDVWLWAGRSLTPQFVSVLDGGMSPASLRDRIAGEVCRGWVGRIGEVLPRYRLHHPRSHRSLRSPVSSQHQSSRQLAPASPYYLVRI